MADMNPKALQILNYIRDRIDDGLPPSVREICAALDIKSTSTAHKYLGELQERGLIEKSSHLNRAITLPGPPGGYRHRRATDPGGGGDRGLHPLPQPQPAL